MENSLSEYIVDRPAEPTALSAVDAFAHGFVDSLKAPVVGAKQMLGDEAAAREFYEQQAKYAALPGCSIFEKVGSFLGTSSVFIAGNFLLSRVGGLGKAAPVMAGALHGFMQPTREGESGATRAMNAALGAGTMWWLENGVDALCRRGVGGWLLTNNFSFNAITGVAHSQVDSLIHTGRSLGFNDSMAAGAMWGITGVVTAGANVRHEKFRSWTMGSGGDRSSLGREFARIEAEGQRGIPSFEVRNLGTKPVPRVLDGASPTDAQLYKTASPAIVRLRTSDGRGGSGFFIDTEGTIATSTHVIRTDSGKLLKIKADLADGQTLRAKLVSADVENDIALVKVEGIKTPKLDLAESSPAIGASVYVMGHPDLAAKTFQTKGVRVGPSPAGFKEEWQGFETNAPVFGGNSGGPALNAEGQVVGVLTNSTFGGRGLARRIELLHELVKNAKSE